MPVVVVGIPFIAIIVALAAWQIAQSWDYTFGPLLKGLADRIDAVHIRIPHVFTLRFGWLAAIFRRTEASARHEISSAIQYVSRPLVIALQAFGAVVLYPARELSALAVDVAHTLGQLRRVIVPAMIAAHVAWIPRRLIALAHRIEALAVRAPVHIITHTVEVAKPAIVNVVNKAVAVPLPRIGRLEREADALRKRLGSIARHLSPSAVAALAVAAVATTVGGWVRCSRVKRLGRGVCGMDDSLLESLLADTLLIVGTVSLVEFARGMQDVTEEVAPLIRTFWRAT